MVLYCFKQAKSHFQGFGEEQQSLDVLNHPTGTQTPQPVPERRPDSWGVPQTVLSGLGLPPPGLGPSWVLAQGWVSGSGFAQIGLKLPIPSGLLNNHFIDHKRHIFNVLATQIFYWFDLSCWFKVQNCYITEDTIVIHPYS